MQAIRATAFLLVMLVLGACGGGGGNSGTGSGAENNAPSTNKPDLPRNDRSLVSIKTTFLAAGEVDVAYVSAINTGGESGSNYTWSVTNSALPAGLSLVPGTSDASLAGVPTASGTFNFTLQVSDPAGGSDTRAFSLLINVAHPPLLIATNSLTNGTVGSPYTEPMSASGGTGAYTWSVISGALPDGLGLVNGIDGTSLEGTPTTQGVHSFAVEVRDTARPPRVATRSYSITVWPAPEFVGIPVRQSMVFLIDCSSSMEGSRIVSIRAELTSSLYDLPESAIFDCVAFGAHFSSAQSYTNMMWGGLLPATTKNVEAAVNWVNGPATNPGSGTPTYPSVQRVCEFYPATLESIFLITDGSPDMMGTSGQLLADFPGMYERFTDCHFNTVGIGNGSLDYLDTLAELGGGKYVRQ